MDLFCYKDIFKSVIFQMFRTFLIHILQQLSYFLISCLLPVTFYTVQFPLKHLRIVLNWDPVAQTISNCVFLSVVMFVYGCFTDISVSKTYTVSI